MNRLPFDPFATMRWNVFRALGDIEEDIQICCDLLKSHQKFLYTGPLRGTMEEEHGRDRIEAAQPQGCPRQEPPPMPENHDWPDDVVWMTPEEEAIWRVVVCVDTWVTSKEISQRTGLPPDKELDFMLRHMVRRKFLESAQGRGYRRRKKPPSQ